MCSGGFVFCRFDHRACSAEDGSTVLERQLVVANSNEIAICERFSLNALAQVLKPVRRAEVDDVIGRAVKFNHGMLTGDVRILDGQVAALLAASDDELLFVDDEALTLVADLQLFCRRSSCGCGHLCARERARMVPGWHWWRWSWNA